MADDTRGLGKLKEEGREEEVSEIASKGGKAAHESGKAHEFDSEEAREAGRKGGEARAQDEDVKSGELGRKGAAARWGKDED